MGEWSACYAMANKIFGNNLSRVFLTCERSMQFLLAIYSMGPRHDCQIFPDLREIFLH